MGGQLDMFDKMTPILDRPFYGGYDDDSARVA